LIRAVRFVAIVGAFALISAAPAQADAGPKRPHEVHAHSCSTPTAGHARCHADIRLTGTGTPAEAALPLASKTPSLTGLTPTDLQTAYQLAVALPANRLIGGAAATGPTVAVVDAYDNPNAEADLAAYRTKYQLPPCTTRNGCFRKINQRGATITNQKVPAHNVGWGQEIDLDIEMVSAACPTCRILLVEADDNTFTNLGLAVDRAALSGANAISNSYGGLEFAREILPAYNDHFRHPGIAITASSGDSGFGVQFPAASQYVTAVGGTTLLLDASRKRSSEAAWSGAGSGCSAFVTKPTWQPSVGTCAKRMVADVSAVADPATGVNVYDSYGSVNGKNWYVFGGTSVASPIIASVYALNGNAASVNDVSGLYSPGASLNDVTSGANGPCPTNPLDVTLCTASVGWDGPTGLGTPNGTSAF
jgi:subtilase family serine protease